MTFTGIVEEMGDVVSMVEVGDLVLWDGSTGKGHNLTIKCTKCVEDAELGCSIAVNGTCLTVTEFDTATGIFTVGVAPETLRCTNLGDLVAGGKVNLERAMAGNARNSGHNVQGHVDEAGRIKRFRREGESLWVYIEASAELLKSIVPKGYIAVDGTSLTVCEVNYTEGWFNLMLIPHTQNNIIMPTKKVGDRVNLEPDVIAKYVQRVVESVGSGAAHAELVQRLGAVERAASCNFAGVAILGVAVGALIGAFVAKTA